MNNIIEKFKIIMSEYEDDKDIIKKLENHVLIDIPELIMNWKKQEEELNKISILKNNYITDFLMRDNEQYFYHKNENEKPCYYIKYDGINYILEDEDSIWHKIIMEIQTRYESSSFANYKHSVAEEIIEQINNNDLMTTIPESITIQNIISFLSPMLLKTKEEVKYFLATLGDCIFSKNEDIIFYVSELARDFITEIESYYKDFFGKPLYNNQYKFKYRGADYDKSRIIMFKKTIINKEIWKNYIKNNFLNLLVVSAHYSNRYGNSDIYISKQSNELQNKIFYLKNNTKQEIINEFKSRMLISCDFSTETINEKNMYFLWKIFCDSKNIPVIIYKNDFINLLKNELRFEEDQQLFTFIKSDYLNPAKKFNKFWEQEMIMDEEIDEEYELSEICELYNIWLEAGKKQITIKEYQLKNLILYFQPNVKLEGKYLYNLHCRLWNKKKDISECLKNKFNKELKKDITILKAYKSYCAYGDQHNFVNIVSKRYFMKYIGKIIPQQYMKNNNILLDYWNQ